MAQGDLELEQLDVKIIFLHGEIEERICLKVVQEGEENMVCLLKKSFYGLKQSPRQWYKRFNSFMIKANYTGCEYESQEVQ